MSTPPWIVATWRRIEPAFATHPTHLYDLPALGEPPPNVHQVDAACAVASAGAAALASAFAAQGSAAALQRSLGLAELVPAPAERLALYRQMFTAAAHAPEVLALLGERLVHLPVQHAEELVPKSEALAALASIHPAGAARWSAHALNAAAASRDPRAMATVLAAWPHFSPLQIGRAAVTALSEAVVYALRVLDLAVLAELPARLRQRLQHASPQGWQAGVELFTREIWEPWQKERREAQAFMLRVCCGEAEPTASDEVRLAAMLAHGEPAWGLWGPAQHVPRAGQLHQLQPLQRDVLAERVAAGRRLRAQGLVQLNRAASEEMIHEVRAPDRRTEEALNAWRHLPPAPSLEAPGPVTLSADDRACVDAWLDANLEQRLAELTEARWGAPEVGGWLAHPQRMPLACRWLHREPTSHEREAFATQYRRLLDLPSPAREVLAASLATAKPTDTDLAHVWRYLPAEAQRAFWTLDPPPDLRAWRGPGLLTLCSAGGSHHCAPDLLAGAAQAASIEGDTASVERSSVEVTPGPLPEPPEGATPRCLGRTVIFTHPDGSHWAYKVQRDREPVRLLTHEHTQLARKGPSARSELPEPVGVGPVPAAVLRALPGHADPPGGTHALLYRAPNARYFVYVNDLPRAQRREALLRAIDDLVTWLAAGEIHAALTVKNHNAAEEGDRPYLWMIDLMVQRSGRRGMGRLDRVPALCAYPNLRQSGVADLAEMTTVSAELRRAWACRDTGRAMLYPTAMLVQHGAAAPALLLMAALGDLLFDVTLLIADAHRRSGALGDGRALGEELEDLWRALVAAALRDVDSSLAARVLAPVSFALLGAQLAYFLTPERYAPDFDATVAPNPEGGWRRPGRCIVPAAEALAERLAPLMGPQVRVRVDLSRSYKTWRPCDRPPPHGFCADGVHPDLGPYNGPFPVVELEWGLYAVTTAVAALAPWARATSRWQAENPAASARSAVAT